MTLELGMLMNAISTEPFFHYYSSNFITIVNSFRASAPDLTIFIISTASNSTEGLKDAVKALKDYSE